MIAALQTTVTITIILFLLVMVYCMYVIVYFFYLRLRGIISSGYQVTYSAFDYELSRTNDPYNIRKLRYGRKLYQILIYAFSMSMIMVMLAILLSEHFGVPV